ncbi:MAG: glutamate decarboxylase, partial [Acidimicrobiia bacterium]|nr:glutamate decarboxylase [Acidimicrobiia bacterium]
VFNVDYLGGEMPTFGLNFSRPGAQVAAQYYNLIRLGRDGYRRLQQECRDVTRWLAGQVAALPYFELLSDGGGIPAFAFGVADDAGFTVFDVSERIRERGWIVPAYKMPPDLEDLAVLRVVVRNGFSRDLAALFLGDLKRTVDRLATRTVADEVRTGFHH